MYPSFRNTSILTINWRCNAGFLAGLDEQMQYIQSHAWVARTRKTLDSQTRAFKEFAELAEIEYLPLPPDLVCFYAVWL